jgi:hypothetical protein
VVAPTPDEIAKQFTAHDQPIVDLNSDRVPIVGRDFDIARIDHS